MEAYGQGYAGRFSQVLIFMLMALVILVRPSGSVRARGGRVMSAQLERKVDVELPAGPVVGGPPPRRPVGDAGGRPGW